MCGIAGLINLNNESVHISTLKLMTDAIAHRGPDGEGHWVSGNVGIGHRRLSIIDLSASGSQPMTTADGRYILTYNGELYNYRELRYELEDRGVKFGGASDTEVVLYALAEWGIKALKKFNGMFALGLFDQKKNQIVIARDRYGVKPVYYSRQGNNFAFGSEQKAITALPSFDRRINIDAAIEYFTFQNILSDQSLLKDIRLLGAGCWLTLDIKTGEQTHGQYWDYQFVEPDEIVSDGEYLEELDRLFQQAVQRQLIGEVEIGTYLSGGIDSGSITAVASEKLSSLKSFTVGFDLSSASGLELAFDERAAAEAMSAKFQTEHYEMVLKAGDMERCLLKLAWHVEEPRVGQSYPNYYAAKLASKFVKVVMSGAGGDELFGGYPWRYYKSNNHQCFDSFVDSYYAYWQRLVEDHYHKAMFSPVLSEYKNVSCRDIFAGVFKNYDQFSGGPESCVNSSLYFEAKTFLHGLFVIEDKLSMAHGLETRVPFMDNDLVDFATKCPVRLKINNLLPSRRGLNENSFGDKKNIYFERTNDGKQILRSMMTKYVSKEAAERKKQGFSSPDGSWFKGQSMNFVKSEVLDRNSPIYNILDYRTVETLVNQHLEGKRNRRLLIWSLLSFDAWMKTSL